MTSETAMMTMMFLWIAWFFFGGSWALIRVVVGMLGFKQGRDKWSGFKGFLLWMLINIGISGWILLTYGSTY